MKTNTLTRVATVALLILITFGCAGPRRHVGCTPESRKSERLSIKATAQFNPH